MRRPTKDVSGAKLDLTAMIDVVFLLLIFFMCATTFRVPEGSLRAFLPRDQGARSSEPPHTKPCRVLLAMRGKEVAVQVDFVAIHNDETYVTDFERAREVQAPDEEAIYQHIRQRQAASGDGAVPVVIDFDRDVPVRYVVRMLDICHRAEVKDIAFAAPAEAGP